MKHRVRIEVPLSGINDKGEIQTDTFAIEPPCFYCGKPIASNGDGYFSLDGDYNIKFWGYKQDTLKPKMGDVIDPHGNYVKGKYAIKIPYCQEHIKPVRLFTVIDSLTILLGTLFGIGLTAFFGTDFFSGTSRILAFILIPLFFASLFYGIGIGIKLVIPKLSPRLKDYEFKKGHYGICTHGVRVNAGEEKGGPITYWLKLAFCNPEGALRFLDNNPEAKVIEGERYLKEPS